MNSEWISWKELVESGYVTNEMLLKYCEDGAITCYNKDEIPYITTKKCSFYEQRYPAIIYGRIDAQNNVIIDFPDSKKIENNIYVHSYELFNFYFNSKYNEFYILRKDIFPTSFDIMAYRFILKGLPCYAIISKIYKKDMSLFIPEIDVAYSYPICINTRIFETSINEISCCAEMCIENNEVSYKELYIREYFIPYVKKIDIGFSMNTYIKISFNEEKRIDYQNTIDELNVEKIDGFNYGDPFCAVGCKDESLLKNPNIWELSIEKRLIVYSFTNKSIVIIDDKKRVFPCDLKHIFDSCDEFDVNITSCNESDLSRVMNTSAYRTIEKKFYDYNAIPLEFNTKKHLLYLGYPNKDEYIEKVMFKNLENLKFKMLDINNILMINVHTDKYLINKYIKTWIKYYNEEKEVFDKETKKRCVNVSILKLENKKLTNSDIWCKYHTKQEQHELDIAKKSKDADDKRFCAKVRKWTTNEFKRASQIPPPDGLPPWPSKWDRDEREELLDKLAQIYGVKRNS